MWRSPTGWPATARVLALGGGVVGDMAGFAAAAYQRGIDFVQVPTTLLAQVDSSVGGKTGVNHPGGKNLIGAFHQPVAVIADTNTLETLPPRELRAGLAEVIKYGLIYDAAFFDWLELNIDQLLAGDPQALTHAITPLLRDQGADRQQGRTRARRPGAAQSRSHLRARDRIRHGLRHLAARRGGRRGHADGRGDVARVRLSDRRGRRATAGTAASGRSAAGGPRGDRRSRARAHENRQEGEGRAHSRFVLLERIGAALVTADYPPQALHSTLAGYFG